MSGGGIDDQGNVGARVGCLHFSRPWKIAECAVCSSEKTSLLLTYKCCFFAVQSWSSVAELWEEMTRPGEDGSPAPWYRKAVAYWSQQEASNKGVLGGFDDLNPADITDSSEFVLKVHRGSKTGFELIVQHCEKKHVLTCSSASLPALQYMTPHIKGARKNKQPLVALGAFLRRESPCLWGEMGGLIANLPAS